MNKVTTENYDEVFNEIHSKLKEYVYSASDTLVKAIQDALCMAIIDSESFDDASRKEIVEKIRNFNVGENYVSTSESRDFSKVLLIFYVVYASYKGVIKLTPKQKQDIGQAYFGCDILEYIEEYINIENASIIEETQNQDIEQPESIVTSAENPEIDLSNFEFGDNEEGYSDEESYEDEESFEDEDSYEDDYVDAEELDDPDAFEDND